MLQDSCIIYIENLLWSGNVISLLTIHFPFEGLITPQYLGQTAPGITWVGLLAEPQNPSGKTQKCPDFDPN